MVLFQSKIKRFQVRILIEWIDVARAVATIVDQKILHVLPQEFLIDAQEGVKPLGMSGVRLEAKVHLVTQ